MIFELELEGEEKDTLKPNNSIADTPTINNDHHLDDEDDQHEDMPVTRSLSATSYRSKPEPQILQHPMAFSYNTGRSLDKSERVQKKMDLMHKKPREKQLNDQDSASLKMN